MFSRLLVTVGIAFYAFAVPALEINATHVFNPDWPSHARLHEVWQLAANTLIGLFCLWLVWIKKELIIPSILTFCITGGFLFSYVMRGSYGGSMLHSDGSEATVLGINLGVFGFGLAIILAVLALALSLRTRATGGT